IATAAALSAPTAATNAVNRNNNHGTKATRPRTSRNPPSTTRSSVPFTCATPNRYVTPTNNTNRSAGKPASMSSTSMPPRPAPTTNAATNASKPRFTGSTEATTNITTSTASAVMCNATSDLSPTAPTRHGGPARAATPHRPSTPLPDAGSPTTRTPRSPRGGTPRSDPPPRRDCPPAPYPHHREAGRHRPTVPDGPPAHARRPA